MFNNLRKNLKVMKIIDFLKKNIKYILIVLGIIFIIVYVICRENRIAKDAADLSALNVKNNALQDDRDKLIAENDLLIKEQTAIEKQVDSLRMLQVSQRIYYESVIKKNKQKIDSLMNIPNDTVYVRLQPLYPNLDQGPLIYPFSGSQIRQVYQVAVSYPLLQQQYGLQANILNTCNILNKKYADSEVNYKSQIGNLGKDIDDCNKQFINTKSELKITKDELEAKSFWNWVYKGLLIGVTAIAIVK
jgi:hypothetical protein